MTLPGDWISSIESALGQSVIQVLPLSGGSTGNLLRLLTPDRTYAAKLAPYPTLQAEKEGIDALKSLAGINVPMAGPLIEFKPDHGCLILEFIEVGRSPNENNWKGFFEQLAKLHHTTGEQFGWGSDNYIGPLLLQNGWHRSWPAFFLEQRLDAQWFAGQKENCIPQELTREYMVFRKVADQVLQEAEVTPTLVHGDLWSGNVLFDTNAHAVFIDPSVSYGHWEVDLAMMQLFGGFPARLMEKHIAMMDPAKGIAKRLLIYQSYYLLVHVRLFGSSYLSGVQRIMRTISAGGY